MSTPPWNKDRIIGKKSHFRYLISGGPKSGLNLKVKRAIWLCSIWPWTVSYEAVIWLNSKYLMLHMVTLFQAEQQCCKKKPVALSSLR